MNAEEIKREKARNMRYKKAIVSRANMDYITQTIWEIMDDCEEVRWFTDTDEDTLINALDGNEDEAYEFKMMFADLCAECERMLDDLQEEYVSKHFDDFFVVMGADESFGSLLGWDAYEGDYFGIAYEDFARTESGKRLMQLTKPELLNAAKQCFKIFTQFYGLQNRYDNLKACMDILKGKNSDYLQMVQEIEKVYDEAEKEEFVEWGPKTKHLEKMFDALPQEAWLQ